MARTRTTKAVAQRIDLNYFKRATPFKRAKMWLAIAAPAVALLWIGWHFFGHDNRVYSSGQLSAAHAVLEKQCAACHVQQAGGFSATAADSACLACHDGPTHHEAAKGEKLACAECHVEHRGRVNLAATRNQSCAQCHGNLAAASGATNFAKHILSFQDGHPEFAALRTGAKGAPRDGDTIKLNHALHMRAIRSGPNGPMVQLDCTDCHRPPALQQSYWTYGDAKYISAATSYKANDEFPEIISRGLTARRAASRRELMAPPTFASTCAGCHLLTFDARFDEGVPHDKPEVIHAFLLKKFSTYIAGHPVELREVQDPRRQLTGRPNGPAVRSLSPAQWVAERVAISEELLWHKTCSQCHAITATTLQDVKIARWDAANSQPPANSSSTGSGADAARLATSLPEIARANVTLQWMTHARFDHDAHGGFSCAGCHPNALQSTETSDILIPGIAVCQTCHAPGAGHAESRCFECHTYHDWAKRKEVKPTFTLPGLMTERKLRDETAKQ
jgi:hypothetical protein